MTGCMNSLRSFAPSPHAGSAAASGDVEAGEFQPSSFASAAPEIVLEDVAITPRTPATDGLTPRGGYGQQQQAASSSPVPSPRSSAPQPERRPFRVDPLLFGTLLLIALCVPLYFAARPELLRAMSVSPGAAVQAVHVSAQRGARILLSKYLGADTPLPEP